MNITSKIIITDTSIITDLNNANILKEFVELDNVYISDIIKRDEINSKTCNPNIIDKFKTIETTSSEFLEATKLNMIEKKLSLYDILNFLIARDNDCILATGDNRLKKYSEKNGVEVYRTLKIIKLMVEKNIINYETAIKACNLLKDCPTTRIPQNEIDNLINMLEKNVIPN